MNRRQVLLGALATAALTQAPLAFADPATRRALLSAAWERAATAQRPLLVLVVPPKEQAVARAYVLGHWLSAARPAELAALNQVELCCVTLDELDKLVPGVAQAQGAWMVLVRVDQQPPTWRSILPSGVPRETTTTAHATSTFDPPRVDPKLKRASLTGLRASVARVFASEGLVVDEDHRALSKQAYERFIVQAPPGARWAANEGCGTFASLPSPGGMKIGCGMGSLRSRHAERFLEFWSEA